MNVSRLAPVFVIGEYKKWETIRMDTNKVENGGYYALYGNSKHSNYSKKYELVEHQLEQALNEFGYRRLDATKMNQPLPFVAEIRPFIVIQESKEYRMPFFIRKIYLHYLFQNYFRFQ